MAPRSLSSCLECHKHRVTFRECSTAKPSFPIEETCNTRDSALSHALNHKSKVRNNSKSDNDFPRNFCLINNSVVRRAACTHLTLLTNSNFMRARRFVYSHVCRNIVSSFPPSTKYVMLLGISTEAL